MADPAWHRRGQCFVPSRNQHPLVALTAVVIIWAASLLRWHLSDGVVPWDSKNQFFAFFRFLAESLHAGTSVYWNPYHYGGHPSIADPQSLIFSPPFLLWAWFDRAPTLRAFDFIVYAHLLIGGLAIVGLGVRRRWPAAASIIAAAVFMLGGSASSRLNHTGIILCYSLFPLALLTLETTIEKRSWPGAIGFSAITAMIVVGRNQVALMLCFMLVIFAMREFIRAPQPLSLLRSRLPLLLTSTALIIVAAAVPLILTLQLASLSNRPAVLLQEALEASLYPANLASLAIPNFFGSHVPGFRYWGPQFSILPEVGATDDSFNYLFIGAGPAILLLWLGLSAGRFTSRGCRTLALILVGTTLFSLGRYTPLFSFVFEHIPGFTFFRRPVDGTFLMTIAMALLTGHLLSEYVQRGLPAISPLGLAVTLSGILALLILSLDLSSRTDHAWDSLEATAVFAAIAVPIAAAIFMSNTAHHRELAATIVAVVTVAELLTWNAASRLNSENRRHYALLEAETPEDAEALHILRIDLRRRQIEGARPRIEIIGLQGPWQNLAMVYKLEATNGYNPLRIGIYDRFIAPGESSWVARSRRFPKTFDGYDCDLARALGLEYIVMDRPLEDFGHVPRRRRHDVLLAGPKIWIYRIPGAMPRVSFNSRIEVADVDATTASGELQHPPSAEHTVIDDETVPQSGIMWMRAAGENSTARIVSWRPGRIEIEVDAAQAGVLTLRDIYYPGWIAEVDGQSVPVLRADVLFRAVEVPAGRHIVNFRFEPLSASNLLRATKMLFNRPQSRQRIDEE